ncbi:MAG: 50S ribosomal protein L17 [Alkalispirochaeta sp.]|jgi:large subunit ribosomal protein L17
MKHKIGYNRLGRRTGHRKAMTRNMLTSLFRHGRIRTTKAKALAVRRTAEKMITRAKLDSVHNRRIIGKDIKDKAVLAGLFTEIGPRFKERPGGYTRVLKLGPRQSDAAEMVILELLSEDEGKSEKSSRKKTDGKKAGSKKADTKKADAKKAEPKKAESKKAEPVEAEAEQAEPKKTEAKTAEPQQAAPEASAEDAVDADAPAEPAEKNDTE